MTASFVNNRYDFVYLFDVQDGNPNGDPDLANTPRFDPETFQGLVSDVCLKRKIRDWVFAKKSESGKPQAGYDVFVLQGHSLESRQKMPYDHLKIPPKTDDRGKIAEARNWMCANFFDVRAFGAVMSTTDFNCGQVRGPVQITFARSIDRILSSEHGITRVAYTKEEKKASTTASTEMGNKHTVAYGLYRAHGFVNAHLAAPPNGTGFHDGDLALLWSALTNMFDLDHSAARGLMAARRLIVFKHASALGEAPAHRLFDLVTVRRKEGIESPRAFGDYQVTPIDEIRKGVAAAFPQVEVLDLI
ncbi:MAG: type I-C CRISPR-associated protein Cas7/Csd2 [Candidatus Riflebacteria bacterium]|nr:type I-C CRISPR-associated protein Cas7/Csd2 [Candidatus Riflebacteria bacterium]